MTQVYILEAIIFIFSLIMGGIVLPRIINISNEKKLAGLPNERDVHITPTPRLGGIAFLPIALMGVFLFNMLCVLWIGATIKANDTNTFMTMQACGLGLFLLFLVGVADDIVSVDFKAKFAAQIIAGLLLVVVGCYIKNLGGLFGIWEIPSWIGMPLTVFLVVYITNGINLIDGVDGLASGICILALSLYATIFIYAKHPSSAAICLSILGVLCAFFVFNVFGGKGFKLQKVFMGDTGSLTLGYIISYLFIIISNFSVASIPIKAGPVFIAISPLIIPLLDIIRVVSARYRDRVPLFQPDRRHIHHKILRTGASPIMVMIILLAMTAFFIILNLILNMHWGGNIIFIIDIICWTLMHFVLNHYIRIAETKYPELAEKYRNPKNTIK